MGQFAKCIAFSCELPLRNPLRITDYLLVSEAVTGRKVLERFKTNRAVNRRENIRLATVL